METLFRNLEKAVVNLVEADVDHITICTNGKMLFTSGLGSPEEIGQIIASYMKTTGNTNWQLLDFLKDLVYEMEYQKRKQQGSIATLSFSSIGKN